VSICFDGVRGEILVTAVARWSLSENIGDVRGTGRGDFGKDPSEDAMTRGVSHMSVTRFKFIPLVSPGLL
jgi:hypothetical protein